MFRRRGKPRELFILAGVVAISPASFETPAQRITAASRRFRIAVPDDTHSVIAEALPRLVA